MKEVDSLNSNFGLFKFSLSSHFLSFLSPPYFLPLPPFSWFPSPPILPSVSSLCLFSPLPSVPFHLIWNSTPKVILDVLELDPELLAETKPVIPLILDFLVFGTVRRFLLFKLFSNSIVIHNKKKKTTKNQGPYDHGKDSRFY